MPARERECLRLVGQRLSSKEAARLLQLQPSTVRTLNRRACERLGVSDRREAAALLSRHEADDPVVSEWLQRLLTTVSAAAAVLDQVRVEATPSRISRASDLDVRRPPFGGETADAEGERGHGGSPSERTGRGSSQPDVSRGAARNVDHTSRRVELDAHAKSGEQVGAASDVLTAPTLREALGWTAVAVVGLVIALVVVVGLYMMMITTQHYHEAAT